MRLKNAFRVLLIDHPDYRLRNLKSSSTTGHHVWTGERKKKVISSTHDHITCVSAFDNEYRKRAQERARTYKSEFAECQDRVVVCVVSTGLGAITCRQVDNYLATIIYVPITAFHAE